MRLEAMWFKFQLIIASMELSQLFRAIMATDQKFFGDVDGLLPSNCIFHSLLIGGLLFVEMER